MKNTLTFIALLLSFTLFAQQETTGELEYKYHIQGTHNFSLGVGFPNLVNSGFTIADNLGLYESDGGASPVFTIKHEYGLTPEIGVGVHLGFFTAQTPKRLTQQITQYTNQLGEIIPEELCQILGALCTSETITEEGGYDRYTVFTPGLRFAYHQRVMEQLDTYAHVVVGYNLISKKRDGSTGADLTDFLNVIPPFAYFTGAGARYYFSPQFAVYGEVGYGALTLVNIGATYRLQ